MTHKKKKSKKRMFKDPFYGLAARGTPRTPAEKKKLEKQIEDLRKIIDEHAAYQQTLIREHVMWNLLHPEELRSGSLIPLRRAQVIKNQAFEERVYVTKARKPGLSTLSYPNNVGVSVKSLVGLNMHPYINNASCKGLSDSDKVQLFSFIGTEEEKEDWADIELVEGTLVEVTNQFGGIRIDQTNPELPKMLFVGWVHCNLRNMHLGSSDVDIWWTQKWMIGEEIVVQNLPKRCYRVISPGAGKAKKPWL